jgi:hypothetical protein
MYPRAVVVVQLYNVGEDYWSIKKWSNIFMKLRRRQDPPCMLERLPYWVMALHGGVIVGGDIYIRMTFNSAPLTSHDTMY